MFYVCASPFIYIYIYIYIEISLNVHVGLRILYDAIQFSVRLSYHNNNFFIFFLPYLETR